VFHCVPALLKETLKKTQATPTKASRSAVSLKVGLAWKMLREQKQIPWFQLEKSGFPLFDGPFFWGIPAFH
jgi:hypothetical protein